jgi:hypothetical protein
MDYGAAATMRVEVADHLWNHALHAVYRGGDWQSRCKSVRIRWESRRLQAWEVWRRDLLDADVHETVAEMLN